MTISKKTHVFDLAAKRISTLDMTGFAQQCVILVSDIYPIRVREDAGVAAVPPVEGPAAFWTDDTLVTGFLASGELRQILKEYTDWPVEDVDVTGFLVSGELRQILITYSNWSVEDVSVAGFLVSGSLE